MKSEEREKDTGQSQDHREKPLSPMPLPKKKKVKSGEDKQPTCPLTNGSLISESQENQKKPKESLENAADSGPRTTQTPKRPKKPRSLMPAPKLPQETSRVKKELERLKVKPEALQAAPPITQLIKTTVKGGLKVALEAMRFSMDDSEIKAFMKVYDKIPVGAIEGFPWEAIAIAAKVNPKHLIGAIQLAVQTHCWNRSRFIAVSNHPEITKARVKYGKMANGEKDRTALDIALGIMQSPKGPTFIGTQQVAVFGGRGGQKTSGGGNTEEGKIIEGGGDEGFDDLFPSPNNIQEKLVPIRQRLLESSLTKTKGEIDVFAKKDQEDD